MQKPGLPSPMSAESTATCCPFRSPEFCFDGPRPGTHRGPLPDAGGRQLRHRVQGTEASSQTDSESPLRTEGFDTVTKRPVAVKVMEEEPRHRLQCRDVGLDAKRRQS